MINNNTSILNDNEKIKNKKCKGFDTIVNKLVHLIGSGMLDSTKNQLGSVLVKNESVKRIFFQ